MTRIAGPSWRIQIIEGAMAVVKTYPLVLHFNTPIPNDPDDPLLMAWILAWNFHAFTTDPWHIPIVAAADAWELKEPCLASNAGLFYAHPEELRECVELLLADEPLRRTMGGNGKPLVEAAISLSGKHDH